jgi:hypothetical protein
MGLLRYLHGDDILTRQTGESRSLPPAENELPLLSAYTATPISPTAALAIADVLSAVRVLADAASSLHCTSTERPSPGASAWTPASSSTSSIGPDPPRPRPTSSRL